MKTQSEPLVLLTQSQLETVVFDAVEKALRKLLPEEMKAEPEFLTHKDVTELTGWSKSSLQRYRKLRWIPFIQIGKKILYPRKELYAWIRQGLVPGKKWLRK